MAGDGHCWDGVYMAAESYWFEAYMGREAIRNGTQHAYGEREGWSYKYRVSIAVLFIGITGV